MIPSSFARRRERRRILAWLGACALALGTAGIVGVGLGGAEKAVDLWNGRWIARLGHGEELVAAGRHDEAARWLEALDRDFPAVSAQHRLDRERERVLELLGQSHAALDRKGRALDAFERLVAFDPRNWRNHFLLAESCARFGELDRAESAWRRVLAIHPSHLPTVQALVGLKFDAGLFAEVPPLYEAYLDAWLLGRMTLRLGELVLSLEIPVDGREHALEIPLDLAPGWNGELCLDTAGFSVRPGPIELIGPLRVGVAEEPGATLLGDPEAWTANDLARGEFTTWSALSPRSSLCRTDAGREAASRLRIRLFAFKALPEDLWRMVEQSYRNTLDHEGLAAARSRSVIGGCLEAGSLFAEP